MVTLFELAWTSSGCKLVRISNSRALIVEAEYRERAVPLCLDASALWQMLNDKAATMADVCIHLCTTPFSGIQTPTINFHGTITLQCQVPSKTTKWLILKAKTWMDHPTILCNIIFQDITLEFSRKKKKWKEQMNIQTKSNGINNFYNGWVRCYLCWYNMHKVNNKYDETGANIILWQHPPN